MSKFIAIISSVAVFLFLICFTSCNETVPNYFEEKGIHNIVAKKGTVIVFSLPQNKSTGYELCWLNESKKSPKFKLEQIKSKLKDPNNVDGGGETITYQILVTESGIDTLKFQNCPTRLWQKDCKFFAVDSIRKQEHGAISSTYAPEQKADFEIVVKVEE